MIETGIDVVNVNSIVTVGFRNVSGRDLLIHFAEPFCPEQLNSIRYDSFGLLNVGLTAGLGKLV